MDTAPTLEETRVIKPFLSTFKPEHGREYTYRFNNPIETVVTQETISGKFKAYSHEELSLTVGLQGDEPIYDRLTIRVTSTGRRFRAPFYEDIRYFLATQLCTEVENRPAQFEQIVRALVL